MWSKGGSFGRREGQGENFGNKYAHKCANCMLKWPSTTINHNELYFSQTFGVSISKSISVFCNDT